MTRPTLILAISALLLASPASAQESAPAFEILGLRNWTEQMVRDSFTVHSPGTTLESHACAAKLRDNLKFADASATMFSLNGRETMVVSVIEPQDSARVRYRPTPTDSMAPPPGWSGAVYVLRTRPGPFQAASNSYVEYRQSHALPGWVRRDTADVQTVWAFLESHRSEADRGTAMETLRGDGNPEHRVVAALLMMNFGQHDETWWALADALRDTDGRVTTAAEQALGQLIRSEARRVDWAPAAEPLRALLDGTNLFAYRHVMVTLAATSIDPELGARVLPRDGGLTLDYLGARTRMLAEQAHGFLVAATGQDFGYDVGRWREWLAGR